MIWMFLSGKGRASLPIKNTNIVENAHKSYLSIAMIALILSVTKFSPDPVNVDSGGGWGGGGVGGGEEGLHCTRLICQTDLIVFVSA